MVGERVVPSNQKIAIAMKCSEVLGSEDWYVD